ncbi:MAG: hypothetical protein FWE02_06445 [Defluviitaleaceae bacterium]|nr:hypothetical protein [Defluviitaleaceae bacterium]
MSLPVFPKEKIGRKNAINQILSSIAMEELALSHIINAEGEKLQFVLGTLKECKPLESPTIEQVLQVNQSVKDMLDVIISKQILLKSKMQSALAASIHEDEDENEDEDGDEDEDENEDNEGDEG